MMKKIARRIYGKDLELREQVFRLVVLTSAILNVAALIKSLFFMNGNTYLFFLLQIPIVVIELLATFRYHQIDFAINLAGVVFTLISFPGLFLLSGGVTGAGSIWFVMEIVLIFLCFTGWQFALYLTVAVIADFLTYVVSYQNPELVSSFHSKWEIYFDSFFSVILVGLLIGVIMQIKKKMYQKEHDTVLKKQEDLEQVSKSKNRFFTNMSHEIRTPINTIVGLNEMILRETGENTTREYAENVQRASNILLSLVNDILDLSQMEIKRMEIIPVEYQTVELFEDLIRMMQVRMQAKKLKFVIDIDEKLPTVLLGDAKRIRQVILNLLANAVKYTEEGSVTLSAHMETIQNGKPALKISVQDTGSGIRKEDIEHLYDAFSRADAQKNIRIEGSGLGLAISRQLVELMGGEITVDSIYTRGSVFTVVIPQRIVDGRPIGLVNFLSGSKTIAEEYQRSFEAPEARVLVVDDNDMNALVTGKLLRDTRMQIDYATSGAQCLEMAKKKYYHVILMDYLMPEMDGMETLKELRRQENGLCRDSAVVALSAEPEAAVGRRFLENGFEGYLEKPIHGNRLEEEILKFVPENLIEYRLQERKPVSHNSFSNPGLTSHKRKKIYITTDCVCDLPGKLLEKYDIGLMYLYIRTEQGRFTDTREISSDNLVNYLTEDACNIRADGVSVEEYQDFFAEMLMQAEQVIHISMAANVGHSYGVAVAAARSFDHVQVIDSGQISCGQGLVALYAGKLAAEGKSAEEICEQIERMKKQVESYFLLPSARLFCQHGYMNEMKGKIFALLQLHPVLKMNQSGISCVGFYTGRLEDVWKRFIGRRLFRRSKIDTDVIFISHVACNVHQQEMIRNEVLRRISFEKIYMQKASVSTACNAGVGSIGISYYLNTKKTNM
jgi:DegV family protein with EDD domain